MKRIFHAIALTTVLAFGGQAVWAQDFEGLTTALFGDFETALREWRPLAEQGDAAAQYRLGLLYAFGRGVPQDYAEAVKWYRLAAEQGNANAQIALAQSYRIGEGVFQDYAEAVKWFRLAAEQGWSRAQYNLGTMYADGEGVIQDNLYAHMWYNVSASLGDEDAKVNRDIIAGKMTPEDISKAQALARECVAKNYKDCG